MVHVERKKYNFILTRDSVSNAAVYIDLKLRLGVVLFVFQYLVDKIPNYIFKGFD